MTLNVSTAPPCAVETRFEQRRFPEARVVAVDLEGSVIFQRSIGWPGSAPWASS